MAAMAAPEWEVRNAANMAFTSLINRMLGFKNLAKVSASCNRLQLNACLLCVSMAAHFPDTMLAAHGSFCKSQQIIECHLCRAGFMC